MKLSCSIFLIVICWTTFCGCGGWAKDCDPKNPGFFRNITCMNEWEERIDAKNAMLRDLQATKEEEKKKNQELIQRKQELLLIVKALAREAYEAQQYTEYLLGFQAEGRSIRQGINQLIVKIDNVLVYAERMRRYSPEIYDHRSRRLTNALREDRRLLEKFLKFGTGLIKDTIIFEGIKYFLPSVIKGIGGRIINIISLVKTISDAVEIFGSD